LAVSPIETFPPGRSFTVRSDQVFARKSRAWVLAIAAVYFLETARYRDLQLPVTGMLYIGGCGPLQHPAHPLCIPDRAAFGINDDIFDFSKIFTGTVADTAVEQCRG